jgi:hypothetical protein
MKIVKRNKKKQGVSLMISYVLLVFITISLSIGVYIWLKDYAIIDEKINCKEGTSLRIEKYTIEQDGVNKILNLSIKNNGLFNVSGFLISAGNNSKRMPMQLLWARNQIQAYPGYFDFVPDLGPGQRKNAELNFTELDSLEIIQMQPYIYNKNNIDKIFCEQSVIKQVIEKFFDILSFPGLISYWNFNESDGSVVGDSKGSNDGIVYGDTNLLMHFDEGSGSTTGDDSAYDNDGINNGAIWITGGCQSGSCLSFNGVNSWVDTLLSTGGLSELTVEAWVNLSTTSGDKYIVSDDMNTAGLRSFVLHHQTGSFGFAVWNTAGTVQQAWSAGGDINKWHHVIGVYDGSNVKIYIDGELKETTPALTGLIKSSGGSVTIGAQSTHNVKFNGSIDEVAIYSRALSPTEILEHNNTGRAKFLEWKDDAERGGVIEFDGVNDYVSVIDSTSLNIQGEISVFAWINKNDLTGYEAIIGKYEDASSNREWLLQTNDQKVRVVFGDPNNGIYEGYIDTTLNQITSASTWYYIGFTYSAGTPGTAQIYVNGQPVSSTLTDNMPNDLFNGISPVRLGVYGAALNFPFNGRIDDVAIFNTALTSEEIKTIYCNQGGTAGCP